MAMAVINIEWRQEFTSIFPLNETSLVFQLNGKSLYCGENIRMNAFGIKSNLKIKMDKSHLAKQILWRVMNHRRQSLMPW